MAHHRCKLLLLVRGFVGSIERIPLIGVSARKLDKLQKVSFDKILGRVETMENLKDENV